MTTKKDWHPFRGMDLSIRFRGTPNRFIRGRVVSWTPFKFQFQRTDRVRPYWYLEEEIVSIKIHYRRPEKSEL
jgi:hypothetical protein